MLLAVAGAGFAYRQSREAAQQARIALSRELAAAATHSSDAELQVILAREAVAATYSVDKTVTAEAAAILRKSVPPTPIALRFGHKEPISALAFSPDGNRLATGGENMVKIWDISSKDELLIPSKACYLLAWSGDGGRLVAAEGDKVKAWDSQSGREMPSSHTDEDSIRDVRRKEMANGIDIPVGFFNPGRKAFSPDGKWVAIIGDTSVNVKDASTGEELPTLTKGVDRVRAADFSPNGKRLVTISGTVGVSSIVKVWDIAALRSEPIAELDVADTVVRVAFSPDLNHIAIVSERRSQAYRADFEYLGHSSDHSGRSYVQPRRHAHCDCRLG